MALGVLLSHCLLSIPERLRCQGSADSQSCVRGLLTHSLVSLTPALVLAFTLFPVPQDHVEAAHLDMSIGIN